MKAKSSFISRAGALLSSIVVFSIIVASATIAQATYLIYMPFNNGEMWYCVQGNNGSFTHNGKLAYAYDFTYASGGTFGKEILSPINGEVVDARLGVHDFENNDVISKVNNNGWGNTLLIRDVSTGMYLRFAHMKYGSSSLAVGDKVIMGQQIGQVGQTGFSTNPHLHIQMQEEKAGGSQSVKFYFIEGNVETGSFVPSEFVPKSFVVDDVSDKSLSHEIGSYFSSTSGGWTTPGWPCLSGCTGKTMYKKKLYSYKKSYAVWYKWTFVPKSPGLYMVYARTPAYKYADPDVLYTLYRNYSEMQYVYINQQAYFKQWWAPIFPMVYLATGDTYIIKAEGTTLNKTTYADALMFVKVW